MTNRRKATFPAVLTPEMVSVVVDTREKTPWDLSPMNMVSDTLRCGDYALAGLRNAIRIERKTLDDLLGCVGRNRERFEREMSHMLAYPCRMLVVEATWQTILSGNFRHSKLTAAQVVASLDGWQAKGINVVLAGTRKEAQRYASRVLFAAAKKHWKHFRELAKELSTKGDDE